MINRQIEVRFPETGCTTFEGNTDAICLFFSGRAGHTYVDNSPIQCGLNVEYMWIACG